MKTIKVTKKDDNRRLDNFVLKIYPHIPKTVIFKWIRKSKIKVNNLKQDISFRIHTGDNVTIDIDNQELIQKENNQLDLNKIKLKLDILYEDKNIVIINKPINILSIDETNKNLLTIQNIFLKYLIDKHEYNPNQIDSFTPSICNRLDRNTSGIILAAKNKQSFDELNNLIKNHYIEKYYLTMVFNRPRKNHELLVAYHYKNNKENLVYISDIPKKNYNKILTEYWLKQTNGKYSILEVKLITGKTHQIRAHLSHIGLSIVGDKKYRNKNDDIDIRLTTQALVSYKVKFIVNDQYKTLNYLNGKVFKLNNIWFQQFFN